MTTENLPEQPPQTTGLPSDFWKVGVKDNIISPELKFLHSEIVARLRDEAPEADTLELMTIERIAFLYVFIRAKEEKQMFAHDRAYKETVQLWAGMAATLRKERQQAETIEVIKMQVINEVKGAVDTALKTFDPAVRKQLKTEMGKALATRSGR